MVNGHMRFNVGYLLESPPGTKSDIEVEFPRLRVDEFNFKELTGKFRATRTGEGIFFEGRFETLTAVDCVRCLTETFFPTEMIMEELFYYPASTAPPGEYVVDRDGDADLGPLLRELSVLALPMQPLCRPDCQGLCPECGENLNERACACKRDEIDPRLAVLQQLIDNDDGGDN
ncbi:MAG: DUF177 domain-containing protein [Ardenticatenaceae bacterium]|nr:DUF177 domain-containing protein [Ardenticatenaceae bacterium]